MAHRPQEIGRGQARGTAAYNGYFSMCIRRAFGLIRCPAAQIKIRRKALQMCDRNGILHHLAAASLLAWMRADAPNRGGQRHLLLDKLNRFPILPVCNQADIALAVRPRRAVEGAGRFAIALVVREQQLQRHLARLFGPFALRMDHHAVRRLGGAGAGKLRAAFNFHHA